MEANPFALCQTTIVLRQTPIVLCQTPIGTGHTLTTLFAGEKAVVTGSSWFCARSNTVSELQSGVVCTNLFDCVRKDPNWTPPECNCTPPECNCTLPGCNCALPDSKHLLISYPACLDSHSDIRHGKIAQRSTIALPQTPIALRQTPIVLCRELLLPQRPPSKLRVALEEWRIC